MRATLLAFALLATGAPLALSEGRKARVERAEDRPNIIFILADDIGITGFGSYGGDRFKTPHLDEMAKTGLRFEHCFSTGLCAPSRAVLLTGRYGFRTGVINNNTAGRVTPQNHTIVAKALKEAGYATAVAGKWRQLEYLTTAEEARAWGFDESMVWYDKDGGERYWDPHYSHDGKPVVAGKDKYGPDLLHDFVTGFIDRNKEKPFFVYYPMVSVHGPILRTPDTPAGGAKRDLLADNMAYMDKLVGKLLAELDRLKLREKTLVVFTGDNGLPGKGTLGGKVVDGGKNTLKEGGSRVPLIAQWKGVTPEGKVLPDLVDFSDLYPTFAELAGAKTPGNLDGRSFAAQLKGQQGKPREWVHVQLGKERYVRDARWKLYGDGGFFDMKDAPFAEIPVAADSADPDARAGRARLQAALDPLK